MTSMCYCIRREAVSHTLFRPQMQACLSINKRTTFPDQDPLSPLAYCSSYVNYKESRTCRFLDREHDERRDDWQTEDVRE